MYLIDGHNLIPKIPGFSLRNIDDEQQLIEALQVYCAVRQRDIEVFFDRAPIGYSGQRRFGRLTAHFVRQGLTADDAIRNRLAQLNRAARNATVVSSDRQVQSEARSRGAAVIPSEAFASELLSVYRPAGGSEPPKSKNRKGKPTQTDGTLSQDDLDEWLRLFGEDKDS
jgi:uncharacterized protein